MGKKFLGGEKSKIRFYITTSEKENHKRKTTKQEHHWRVAVSSAPADTRRFHAYTVSHKPVVAQHVQQQQCGQFLESCVAAIIKDTRLLPK